MNRFRFLNIGAVLFLAGCASGTGQVESSSESSNGMAVVRSIELAKAGDESQILINTTAEVQYNVFKLTDPERVMIDLIDTEAQPNLPANISGEGLIKDVQVQPIQDSISTLVRLEVLLSEPANYIAGTTAEGLRIRLLSAASGQDFQDEPADPDFIAAAPAPDLVPPTGDEIPELPLPADGDDLQLSETEPLDIPSMDLEPVSPEETADFSGDATSLSQTAPDAELPESELPFSDMEDEGLSEAPALVPAPVIPLTSAEDEIEEEAEVAEEVEVTEELAATEIPEVPQPSENLELPTAEAPAVEPEVIAAPVPLIALGADEEKEESDDMAVAEAKPEKSRVIVEPEDGPPQFDQVQTQEIPTTTLTEGTSLLTGLSSKVYTGKRVSLEFQDAEIQDVIRLIADVSKLNIILSDDVKGKITLKLVDVPWDQALDIILTSKGLDKVQHGNILRVAPVEKLKKEREIALANDRAAKQLEPLQLKLFNINYATADEMKSRIENLLSERGKVDTDTRTNTLIVEDIPETLSRIASLIEVLDTQTPQVRIESRIVQANDNFTRGIGVRWGPVLTLSESNNQQTDLQFPRNIEVGTTSGRFLAPGASTLSRFAVDALAGSENPGGALGFRVGSVDSVFNLDLALEYAELESLARIVSRPSVTVLDNKTARIIQGSRIPFVSSSSDGSNVQFQEAGIEITVTPQITNDGSIILQVTTSSNEPGGEGTGGNTIINVREADTELLIKSGQTAVLGGVFKTTETEGRGGVPGLMDIPVFGWLFKGESKRTAREETLIFITPNILSDNREPAVLPTSASKLDQ